MVLGPDKVALLLLKVFIFLLMVSLLTSVANIIPYYLNMSRVANDLLMRATINNYVLRSQVDDAIRRGIVENEFINAITYKGTREYGPPGTPVSGSWSVNGSPSGIFVYMAIGDMPESTKHDPGTYSSEYEMMSKNRKVIVNEGNSFDPKSNPSDAVKFDVEYNGAQRGETITVVLEGKMKAKAWFIGFNRDFEIPVKVRKSGPAMYYYRNMGPVS